MLGLHRPEIDHSTHNPASCRLATILGFVAAGFKRSETLHADGWHDIQVHSRIASDRI